MATFDIPALRLRSQQIAQSSFTDPAGLVAWLGAVQAQDYLAALWALGLRLPGSTDAAIQRAFDSGAILRTHVLRPTWHFVTPADIRWLLALTAPRVHAFNASYYRKMQLDAPAFRLSGAVLEKTLQGGKHLTRAELGAALQRAGIPTDDLRLTLLVMHAELDGLLCSGPRRGKQFTYALLEERVPAVRALERDEALAELAGRYFRSHGPATLQDFSWWSGLSPADAAAGQALVRDRLQPADLNGKTGWFAADLPAGKPVEPAAYLLPNFDEYTVGYTDRSAVAVGVDLTKLDNRTAGLLNNIIVLNGQVAGHWKRTIRRQAVELELKPFRALGAPGDRAVRGAAERYREFLGLPIAISAV